ncbi:MAG: methyltransferase domain-containing protein [Planctomycetota bacterium]|jgi:SAM-dependent methyltransferase
MSEQEYSREVSALIPFVSGKSVHLGGATEAPIPGTELVDRDSGLAHDSLGQYEAGSIDSLVSVHGLERLEDSIKALREWRRVLREGGTLAIVVCNPASAAREARHVYSPAALNNLVCTVGGFRVDQFVRLDEDSGWLLVAKREAVLDVRMPMGLQGPVIAQSVSRHPTALAELYFQIGILMLRSGDASLAESCFRSLMNHEPENAHAFFGLGMCLGSKQQWPEALTELQRAVSLDAGNREAQRWVELAKAKCEAQAEPARIVSTGPATSS